MKMNYRRNHTKRNILTTSLLVLALVAVVYWAGGAIAHGVSGAVQAMVVPFLRGSDRISQEAALLSDSLFSSKKTLAEENEQLRTELAELQLKEFSKDILLQENKELKELLGRGTEKDKGILATILTRGTMSPYDTFVIDLGSESVAEGDRVFAGGVFAIGEVSRVYSNSAVVKLFSASGTRFDVLVGDGNVAAVAEGHGGQNFFIQLPRGSDVAEGDLVIVPDMNIAMLGVVEHIDRDPNASFDEVFFKSPVNIQELKWVTIQHSISDSHE